MKKGIVIVLLVLSGLLGVANLILIAGRSVEVVQQGSTLFYGGLIALLTMLVLIMSISTLKQEEPKHGLLSVVHVMLSGVLIVNLLLVSDALVLPVQAALPDFTNQAISDVNEWAASHGIEVVTHEVYADSIAPYHVVGQNVPQGTLAKNIETLEVSLSVGPNYDEVVSLTNMVGWDFDSVNAEVQALHLINYTMNFVEHDTIARDILLSQDKSGDIKRNTDLLLTFSLGPKGSLQPVELIDFTNQSVREASNWLKRYGIGYTITYDFSKDVARGHIISQSIAAKQSVDPYNDKLTLVVSKGVEVVIPDFSTMSKDDILRWAIDAKVNVTFSDAYDDTKAAGSVISASVNKDDKVEEGASIKVVISKGPIVMGDFANYAAFKKWAAQYNINYNEVVEYSTSVAKGEAIRYSVAAGTVLKNNQGITVTVSQGAPVVIPNFIGKSKAAIAAQCNSLGLYCTFVYGGYNAAAKDSAIAQNKTAGASVVSGTGVTITLSSGPAQSYTLVIQESWLQIGSASGTIASLRAQFASRYPGVSFQFVTRSHNSLNAGLIHPDSPTKTGASLSQGKTYTIYIVG